MFLSVPMAKPEEDSLSLRGSQVSPQVSAGYGSRFSSISAVFVSLPAANIPVKQINHSKNPLCMQEKMEKAAHFPLYCFCCPKSRKTAGQPPRGGYAATFTIPVPAFFSRNLFSFFHMCIIIKRIRLPSLPVSIRQRPCRRQVSPHPLSCVKTGVFYEISYQAGDCTS